MDSEGTALKRKSRLAVFEHVDSPKQKRRKKFHPNRLLSSDSESSHSESELVIDFEELKSNARKAQAQKVRVKNELLHMKCDWDDCQESFDSNDKMHNHILNHVKVEIATGKEHFTCLWKDCSSPNVISSTNMLIRHLSYHCYITKLKCIGENVVKRNKLPNCSLSPVGNMEIPQNCYNCEWEHCNCMINNIYEFLLHVDVHVRQNPTGKGSTKEIIRCEWTGCKITFSTQYKLMEHVRVHTKEKLVACPSCNLLFSTKTKFSDHRNRQLKANLRTYQCSQCYKLFSSERILSDHMRAHINQYKCTMCDMTCAKPGMLATHIRYKHLNDKPFECPQCSKKFVTKWNLVTHIRTHQVNPMKCDLCEFGCKSKVGLQNHYKKAHDCKFSIYECHECSSTFRRGYGLTKHLFRVHKFHWPSGHSRFRYKKHQDGIFRLQTVRYESLEVTNELIKSEAMPEQRSIPDISYTISYSSNKDNQSTENMIQITNETNNELESATISQQVCNNILITIDDLDEHGNVVNSQVVESYEMLMDDEEDERCIEGVNDVNKIEIHEEKLESNDDQLDGYHYFSKEIIMNSDDIKIRTPCSDRTENNTAN